MTTANTDSTTTTTPAERAALLRSLHRPGKPLVLANAWDTATAQLVEKAGFPAVATASAAIAPTLGYADHGLTPADEMFAALTRITRAVSVPVTADLEHGYGLEPAELVARIAASGAVGVNLEDTDLATGTLRPAEEQAAYLAAVRAAADAAGYDLVVNARTDVYIHPEQPADGRLAEALRRARLYREAGADCLYPILAPAVELPGLIAAVDLPVNVIALPGGPSHEEWAAMGAARISYGPGIYRLAQATVEAAVRAIAKGVDPYGA